MQEKERLPARITPLLESENPSVIQRERPHLRSSQGGGSALCMRVRRFACATRCSAFTE
jgi:hypothetical protein